MKKPKTKKHYVPIENRIYKTCENGKAACNSKFYALDDENEVTKIKKKVTCKNCKRTKLFRGVK